MMAAVSYPVTILDGKFGKLRALHPDAVPELATSPVLWLCDCGKILEKGYFWVLRGSYTSCGRCNVMDAEYWSSAKFGKLRMMFPTSINKYSLKRVLWACDCGKSKIAKISNVAGGEITSCGKCDWKDCDYWASAKFGKLRMEVPVHIHCRSARRVSWTCDCGNRTLVSVIRVTGGTTSSCGKCNWRKAEFWASTKFGKLRMEVPELMAPNSDKIVSWLCDCGGKTVSNVHHVVSGATRTCGRCNVLPASYWASSVFGKLRMKSPIDLHPNSSKKVLWSCHCGREKIASVAVVYSGRSGSCGKCSMISISPSSKFGKLTPTMDSVVHPVSSKSIEWLCDCGNRISSAVADIVSGLKKSCGKCTVLPSEHWDGRKYGRLTMLVPSSLSPGSGKKVGWLCDCGNKTIAEVRSVVRGGTKSCGKCLEKSFAWFSEHGTLLRSLKTHILPEHIPPGLLSIVSTVLKKHHRVDAVCFACGSPYKPFWHNIRRGVSLSCGCCSNHVSKAQTDIRDLVRSFGLECSTEFRFGGLDYDISVPERNMLIEYNGLRWHSNPSSRERDFLKYKAAVLGGYDYISVFEDEWVYGRDKLISLFRNRLNVSTPKSVRPSKVAILTIKSTVANDFHSENHYVGPCKSKISYGVFSGDRLVACASFGSPTRQSSNEWELMRMSSVHDIRVHGIWSKILKEFIRHYSPSSVVSFSDNRLFSGSVYEKIGFKLDGEVRPDYYWVKGGRRFHKSGLRKKGDEKVSGLTETQLREAQGYRKIWDLGKKRWLMEIDR